MQAEQFTLPDYAKIWVLLVDHRSTVRQGLGYCNFFFSQSFSIFS
jgi:hypothetical protein